MVRVPGSSGNAGFHRESHEDEMTTVKIDEGTTKTLEPGSPVIKKEEGSEGRQSPGRSSAIEVKVEYEEKPKIPPPYVFVKEDNMGHNNYYGPGAPSLTAKAEKRWAPKQVSKTTQETPVSKIKKNKFNKLKAPTCEDETDESEGDQDIASENWTEDDLEEAYHRNKLKIFIRKGPVMKTLKVKMHDEIHGPVTALSTPVTDLEVLKSLMNLLREVAMTTGVFRTEALFGFGFETLRQTLVTLHALLKAYVGEIPPIEVPGQLDRGTGLGPGPSSGSLD